jgi:hypothetical protein
VGAQLAVEVAIAELGAERSLDRTAAARLLMTMLASFHRSGDHETRLREVEEHVGLRPAGPHPDEAENDADQDGRDDSGDERDELIAGGVATEAIAEVEE